MIDLRACHVAIDVRAQRSVLATVAAGRVIDTRRVEHVHPDALADALAVLSARAPGPVVGLAGVWRHAARVNVAAAASAQELLAAVGAAADLPAWLVPHGAALALGEWLRAPVSGPLAVIAVDTGVAGGVVIAGRPYAPWQLDLGHLTLDATGPKCPCGARGCLHTYASEQALHELARDIDLALEEPSPTDWQTLTESHLAALRPESSRDAELVAARAGHALGLAAARLADTFGVVEVRVRTRHPDLWHLLAPAATRAAAQAAGPFAPRLAPADAGEDGYFIGAVASGA